MNDLDLAVLTGRVPKEAVKKRTNPQGKAFDYVSHGFVTRRLNEATGNQWSFSILHVDFVDHGTVGRDGKGGPVMLVTGQLEIPGLGARQDVGSHPIRPALGEDQYKAAVSDCLKRCAMRFGVALELYGEEVPEEEPARPERYSRPEPPARDWLEPEPDVEVEIRKQTVRLGADRIRAWVDDHLEPGKQFSQLDEEEKRQIVLWARQQ